MKQAEELAQYFESLAANHETAAMFTGQEAALIASALRLALRPEGGARWVPVAASIALTRVNEVTIGLPIFGHDQEGQWYRLDGEPKLSEPQVER